MLKVMPVCNQNYRKITQIERGWRCELLNKDGNPDKDWMFWNFNIPKEYLGDKYEKLEELSNAEILYILNDYVNYIDELREGYKKCNLYKNGCLIKEEVDGTARNVICKYIMENKEEYPNASVGIAPNGFHWLVDIEMNIKGIYFYDDLEARPIIDGKELRV